jgi:hypothetical protein
LQSLPVHSSLHRLLLPSHSVQSPGRARGESEAAHHPSQRWLAVHRQRVLGYGDSAALAYYRWLAEWLKRFDF